MVHHNISLCGERVSLIYDKYLESILTRVALKVTPPIYKVLGHKMDTHTNLKVRKQSQVFTQVGKW